MSSLVGASAAASKNTQETTSVHPQQPTKQQQQHHQPQQQRIHVPSNCILESVGTATRLGGGTKVGGEEGEEVEDGGEVQHRRTSRALELPPRLPNGSEIVRYDVCSREALRELKRRLMIDAVPSVGGEGGGRMATMVGRSRRGYDLYDAERESGGDEDIEERGDEFEHTVGPGGRKTCHQTMRQNQGGRKEEGGSQGRRVCLPLCVPPLTPFSASTDALKNMHNEAVALKQRYLPNDPDLLQEIMDLKAKVTLLCAGDELSSRVDATIKCCNRWKAEREEILRNVIVEQQHEQRGERNNHHAAADEEAGTSPREQGSSTGRIGLTSCGSVPLLPNSTSSLSESISTLVETLQVLQPLREEIVDVELQLRTLYPLHCAAVKRLEAMSLFVEREKNFVGHPPRISTANDAGHIFFERMTELDDNLKQSATAARESLECFRRRLGAVHERRSKVARKARSVEN